MKRRTLLQGFALASAFQVIHLYKYKQAVASTFDLVAIQPLNKPHKTWREFVSAEAFKVLFEEDTELPGSSALNHELRDGTFICAACYLPLFDSARKYESGTGWPSFTQPITGHIATKQDFKIIIPRTEYHCARCDGHQGHVFKDGPQPRKERWCNNGVALQFVLRKEHLPDLRS
ncbi:MAG: peptide-methionine (R)-S-oxide reductase MsrB [Nitrosomonas sp.]|nr:peptide-methionine (R)-S-oxide reductase MsrB [Nitrosomonas sp.]MDP1950054.1 peptide-methionine (R)-S-oxide reductase MsrB [Nitrosomonas sp.]